MKKTIFMVIITVLLFIPILANNTTEASSGGKLLLHNEQFLDEMEDFYNKDYLSQIIVLPSDEYQKTDAYDMIKNISKIHPSILGKVVDKNIKLKLFTGPLTNQAGFTHLKGVKPRGYIRYTWDDVPGAGGAKIALAKIGHSAKGKGHSSINLELHELAHSIDKHVFNSIRDDQDFLEIWQAEVENLFPGQLYFSNYPEEYFAEVFAMYYLSFFTRSELFIHAPLTYSFIQELESIEDTQYAYALSFH